MIALTTRPPAIGGSGTDAVSYAVTVRRRIVARRPGQRVIVSAGTPAKIEGGGVSGRRHTAKVISSGVSSCGECCGVEVLACYMWYVAVQFCCCGVSVRWEQKREDGLAR